MTTRIDEETIDTMSREASQELEALIPQILFLGGERSVFTPMIIQTAEVVALYRVCKRHGWDARESGELLYEVAEAYYAQSMSPMMKKNTGLLMYSWPVKRMWRKATQETMKREYPENWVGEYVEGDGRTFEYGLDFTECAASKFLKRHGAVEVAPYICLGDYARMRALGIGFKRTHSINMGGELCDFRFVKGHETPRAWPPKCLEEYRYYLETRGKVPASLKGK